MSLEKDEALREMKKVELIELLASKDELRGRLKVNDLRKGRSIETTATKAMICSQGSINSDLQIIRPLKEQCSYSRSSSTSI